MKKYLHLCPPWYVFHGENNLRQPNVPLGAAYCARAALRAGWDAVIWNGDLLPKGGENQFSEEMTVYGNYLVTHARDDNPVWNQLRAVLRDVRPDVVGITALTPSYPSALRSAAIVREECPNARIVLGGPHPTALPEQVAAEPQVDAAVFGEGERILAALLGLWQRGQPIAGLAGVATRTNQGVVKGPDAGFEADIDRLGWPAKGKVLDRYGLMTRDNYGLVMFSRGCPYPCEFCASTLLWSQRVRWRSAADLATEMLALHREYDTRYFSFEDDTFSVHRKRTLELLDAIIATGLPQVPGFRWTCNTRPDRVDAELLARMKGAGCAAVAVGIEFGSRRMLEKTRKQFTADDVRRSIRLIKEAGLISSGQFMVGYPTETPDEMWETVHLADELECESVMLSVATPLPATPLYQEARRLGLIPPEGIDWARVTTKNNGMLMTEERLGRTLPMTEAASTALLGELHSAFDAIQARTIDAKNSSRQWYEAQYLREEDVVPVYGIKAAPERRVTP